MFKKVLVSEIANHIGNYVSFDFSDGWDDYHQEGYLLAITEPTSDNEPKMIDPHCDPHSLGGYGLGLKAIVYVQKLGLLRNS